MVNKEEIQLPMLPQTATGPFWLRGSALKAGLPTKPVSKG